MSLIFELADADKRENVNLLKNLNKKPKKKKEVKIVKKLSKRERERKLKKLKKLNELIERGKASNPFWWFEPNNGVLDDSRKAVLRRYLREEDIPEVVDSQLDAILSKADIRGVSGGNRSSKTVSGTILAIIKTTGELPKSLEKYRDSHFKEIIERAHRKFIKGRVTAVDNKQLHRVVLDAWKKWIPREYLLKNSWDKSYSKEFDLLTLYRDGIPCASVEFLTNEQKVRSAQGGDLDWALFDEEPDKDKYKETLMRFGTAERLDIEIDWTPTSGLTWATDLFHHGIFTDDYGDTVEIKNSIELFKLTSVCNRYVKDTLIQIMDNFKSVSTYDEMKMRLLGEAISLSGLVYSGLFKKSIHVIEPFELNKEDYIVYRGLDAHSVKPTVCVELAVDREGYEYVVGTYCRQADTSVIKADLARRAIERNYRLGWTMCDKSADSTIHALGDRNIFLELKRGENAIPAIDTSVKYTGSILAGVDRIKQLLKVDEKTGRPKLFIFNTQENRLLINTLMTIERDTYRNEDKKGIKDRIAEGKHDTHAALRYIHQKIVRWIPPVVSIPEYEPVDNAINY